MSPVYSMALGVALLAFGLSFLRRRANPSVVAAASVPLAFLPMLVGSMAAVRIVIDGFREMAQSGTGGIELVSNALLSANDAAMSGALASLSTLLLVGLLSVGALRFFAPDPTATASTFHWKLIASIAALSVLLSLAVGVLLQRTFGLPLAVIAPVWVLEDPNAPRTMRAAEALDLGNPEDLPSMGEVSHTIATRLTTVAALGLGAISLSILGFAVSAAVSFLGPIAPRSAAVSGAVLAGLGLLVSGALILGHRGYAAEVAYILAQHEMEAPPAER